MKNFFNAGLRLISLFSKLILFVYLANYLSLSDLGTFGLIAAGISISISLFGFRFDYSVNRELVNCDPPRVALLIRDQFIIYGISYFIFILGVCFAKYKGIIDINLDIFILAIGITIMESIGIVLSSNLISLQKQITANIQLFIRSASWVLPVILLGYLFEVLRTLKTVLFAWFLGAFIAIAYTIYVFRRFPWQHAARLPLNLTNNLKLINKTKLIWLSTILLACSVYLNRFVTEIYLNREAVGIVSFFSSFIIAIGSLLDSGIYAFTKPKLISLSKKKQSLSLYQETKKTLVNTFIICATACSVIAASVYLFSLASQRFEFILNFSTFFYMLLGAWVASGSYILYILLYALQADHLIWRNEILLFLTNCISLFLLVHWFGIIGVGLSAVVSALIIGLWRVWSINKIIPDI